MLVSISDYVLTIRLEDILSSITIELTCIGGIGALFQWRRTNKINRVWYIYEFSVNIRSVNVIRELLYKLLYVKYLFI